MRSLIIGLALLLISSVVNADVFDFGQYGFRTLNAGRLYTVEVVTPGLYDVTALPVAPVNKSCTGLACRTHTAQALVKIVSVQENGVDVPAQVWLDTGTHVFHVVAKVIKTNGARYIGHFSFKVSSVSDVPSNVCSGASTIHQSLTISKLFMTLADGTRLAYSDTYGSMGGTLFTYLNGVQFGTFPVGTPISYAGVLDGSLICVPSEVIIG